MFMILECKLPALPTKVEPQQLADPTKTHREVSGISEDPQVAIFDYQVCS